MGFEKTSMDTARIKGLNSVPLLSKEKDSFYLDIIFYTSEDSILAFNSTINVYCGKSNEESIERYEKIFQNFSEAGISTDDNVVVLSGKDGKIKAIGSTNKGNWIDVLDNFNVKTFNDLGINLTPAEKDLLIMLNASC